MSDEPKLKPIDAANLWIMDVFTDMANGEIKVLTPVTDQSTRDANRRIKFYSSCTIAHRGRPLVVSFEIPADSLEQALANFQAAGEKAAQEYAQKLKDMDMRASIIMPPPPTPVSH